MWFRHIFLICILSANNAFRPCSDGCFSALINQLEIETLTPMIIINYPYLPPPSLQPRRFFLCHRLLIPKRLRRFYQQIYSYTWKLREICDSPNTKQLQLNSCLETRVLLLHTTELACVACRGRCVSLAYQNTAGNIIDWLAKLNLLSSCSDMIFRSLPNRFYIYIYKYIYTFILLVMHKYTGGGGC